MNRLQSFSKRVLLNRLYSIQNASMKWSSSRKINPHDCNYDIKCRRINEHVLKSSISFYSTKSDHETKENFATGTTDSKTKELLTSLRKSVKEHVRVKYFETFFSFTNNILIQSPGRSCAEAERR